jgi:hypothetical protein
LPRTVAAAPGGVARSDRSAVVPPRGQQADAHEQGLLQDQDEGGRQDVGRTAGLRIEQRHRVQRQRMGRGGSDRGIDPDAHQAGGFPFTAAATLPDTREFIRK